ncbi:MAG: bifunctional 5,10-methylenetetrahydrofolate dehydrogenase/5,10-methenyltetrahydrofolate cyclohydrolase [Candidatus Paceibacterota bacterium]
MIFSGTQIRDEIIPKLRQGFSLLEYKSQLVIVQIGENEVSSVYINQKKKIGDSLGVKVLSINLSEEVEENEILDVISGYNDDEETLGIIVQLPIPDKFDTRKILDSIKPEKDIDGLGSIQTGFLLTKNPKAFVPATARGVLSILDYYKVELSGTDVVIVGRSNLVGLPTAISCIHRDATVTVCNSHTKNLDQITSKADILIVACGKPKLITENFIKKGAIVIDIGIHKIEKGLCGDVDFEKVSEKVSGITPVPGGVGPLTVISLFQNLLDASKR